MIEYKAVFANTNGEYDSRFHANNHKEAISLAKLEEERVSKSNWNLIQLSFEHAKIEVVLYTYSEGIMYLEEAAILH